jgi:hypothetical protein
VVAGQGRFGRGASRAKVRDRVGGRQSSVRFGGGGGGHHVLRAHRAVVLRRSGRRTARGRGVREHGQVSRRGHTRPGQRPAGTQGRTHFLPLEREIRRTPYKNRKKIQNKYEGVFDI